MTPTFMSPVEPCLDGAQSQNTQGTGQLKKKSTMHSFFVSSFRFSLHSGYLAWTLGLIFLGGCILKKQFPWLLINPYFSKPAGASPSLGSPLGRSRHSSSQSDLTGPPPNSSGLSFTACMSDFSLYVFHPYGAGKQKSAVTGLPPGPGPLGKAEPPCPRWTFSVHTRWDVSKINVKVKKEKEKQFPSRSATIHWYLLGF